MANIVITKVGSNGVYIDFGIYESSDLLSPQGFSCKTIEHVEPCGGGVCVKTTGRDPQTWDVSHTTLTGFMTIDTIDGVAPTGQDDLINKLTALM